MQSYSSKVNKKQGHVTAKSSKLNYIVRLCAGNVSPEAVYSFRCAVTDIYVYIYVISAYCKKPSPWCNITRDIKLCFYVTGECTWVLNFKSTNAQKQAVRRKRLFVASCIRECNHCSMPHYYQSFYFTATVFKTTFKAGNILCAKKRKNECSP